MGIAFVRYTHLQEQEDKYLVTLNIAEKMGMLATMAAANSLTIIPEESAVKAGDKIQVLPLDWRSYDKSVDQRMPLPEI